MVIAATDPPLPEDTVVEPGPDPVAESLPLADDDGTEPF
jgi:hypothetical protein